jgi:hypothetical protein
MDEIKENVGPAIIVDENDELLTVVNPVVEEE